MESLTWITPLWKMKISDTQYLELKKELIYAFETNNAYKKRKLSKEAALFCAEWWRREYNGRQPSKIRVLNDLGLQQFHLREFFEYAEKGLKELRISPVRIKMDYKFRTLLMQGGLPIAHIKNSGDGLNSYQRFMIGLIRYVKNISINWNDHSFIQTLDCYNYLPMTFRDDGIFELSLIIANAIITNNDEILPYDITDEYWNEFTQELKRSARSINYKVPFVVRWKIVKENGNIQLFYTLECARKVSESFIHDNNIPDCYSFSIYINNKIAASYRLDTDNIFNIGTRNNIFERWNEEPVLSLLIKTETNTIIEITIPNCTVPDFDTPQLFVQSDTEGEIWDLKTSTVDNKISTVIYTNSWFIKSEVESSEKVNLGGLELNWTIFSDRIELKNSQTGEGCTFDQNESPYFHEFLNWNLDWVQDANYKILISEPQVRVYGEDQEKIAASRYRIYFRKFRDTDWCRLGEQSIPIGLIEFMIIYPDRKFGIEKFYYIGTIDIEYPEMGNGSGAIRINWNGGAIYPLLNQSGLIISEKSHCFWEIRSDGNVEQVYSEKIGFRFQPNHSPELDLFVATPFKGISLIDLKGGTIQSNRIISSSSLFAFRYVIMGHDSVPFKIYHNENPSVTIRGQLKQGINSLSRFDDDIRKLYDLYGAETFDVNSNVKIVLGSGSHSKSVEVRDFNLYAKQEGERDAIRIVNNRNEMQPVDFLGKLFAVSVSCYPEDIQVVQLICEEELFIFNPDEKLNKFIVFTDKFNNNGAVDLIVPRYFDFTSKEEDIRKTVSGISPQEKNILELRELLETTGHLDDEWKKVHKYFIIAVNYNLPFKTFNHFRAIARTPGLLAKLFISLSQSNEVKNAIPLDYMQNALVLFEQEFAVAWHWLNTKNHWEEAIDWLLSMLPSFLHANTLISLYSQINELLDHSLFNYSKDLVNRLLSEDCESMAMPPTISQVNEIRSKLGANQNYPESEIFIPDEWASLFHNAMNSSFPQFIRSFLFSPVKAALAFMGKDLSIWEPENLLTRRVINFYRQLKPNEYLELFENMVCQLKKK